jgi:hypothetical protein
MRWKAYPFTRRVWMRWKALPFKGRGQIGDLRC